MISAVSGSTLSAAQARTPRRVRGLVLVACVGALVISAVATGRSTLEFSYPFLDTMPGRAPDVVYVPTYFPAEAHPLGLTLKDGPSATGTDLEMRHALRNGGLLIWASTRNSAKVEEAAGSYQSDGMIRGTLALWHIGYTAEGVPLLHARIGMTLVVITGALPIEELLRIADSLRQTRPSSLIL